MKTFCIIFILLFFCIYFLAHAFHLHNARMSSKKYFSAVHSSMLFLCHIYSFETYFHSMERQPRHELSSVTVKFMSIFHLLFLMICKRYKICVSTFLDIITFIGQCLIEVENILKTAEIVFTSKKLNEY